MNFLFIRSLHMTNQQSTNHFLLDARQAAAFLGMSLRLFRDASKEPGFPAGRALGPRSTRWVRSELEAFAMSLPRVRREEPPHLTAARASRVAAEPTAHVPFPARHLSGQ